MNKIAQILTLFFLLMSSSSALAWGKRGHSLVCETAAYIANGGDEASTFLKQHSFDFGYYCNVPDLIWKRPHLYKKEMVNHFMNIEVFEREMKKSPWDKNNQEFKKDRHSFSEKYPNVPPGKGRSWWRVQELNKKLSKITKKLKKNRKKKKKHQELQLEWLTVAGVMGHYIADLAMPLDRKSVV